MGSGAWDLRLRVQGSGFRVQGSGFRVQVSGFRVQGSGFRVQGSGFRDGKRHLRGPRAPSLSLSLSLSAPGWYEAPAGAKGRKRCFSRSSWPESCCRGPLPHEFGTCAKSKTRIRSHVQEHIFKPLRLVLVLIKSGGPGILLRVTLLRARPACRVRFRAHIAHTRQSTARIWLWLSGENPEHLSSCLPLRSAAVLRFRVSGPNRRRGEPVDWILSWSTRLNLRTYIQKSDPWTAERQVVASGFGFRVSGPNRRRGEPVGVLGSISCSPVGCRSRSL